MNGARRYASLFQTGQVGRLYLVSGSHARGRTFHIYVLPEGAEAKPNGANNAPLNSGAVEVYGITGGQPGWTETYGWLHTGRWQEDFEALVEAREREIADKADAVARSKSTQDEQETQRIAALLATY